MNDHQEFENQRIIETKKQGSDKDFVKASRNWIEQSIRHNYSYHFDWLGMPIIQYPQDIIGLQQIIWSTKPDLIIETGIARGGSLIFYSSMLELLSHCGGPKDSRVVGIDINIREPNRISVMDHPLSKRIEMIEGSSINLEVYEKVLAYASGSSSVMVCLDSNHTHDHVLRELRLYAPLVTKNCYIVVFDTIVEDLPESHIIDRPWSKGNNPKTAVNDFLHEITVTDPKGVDGVPLKFQIDKSLEDSLLITVASSGYLKRL